MFGDVTHHSVMSDGVGQHVVMYGGLTPLIVFGSVTHHIVMYDGVRHHVIMYGGVTHHV